MTRIEDIMIKDFPICFADSDITNVLIDMSSKKFDVCIAVDSNNKLIGILEIESIKEWLKPRTNVKPKEDYIKKNIITDDLINYDFEVINKNTLVFEVMQIYNKGEENKKNIIVLDENDFAVGFINEEIIDKIGKAKLEIIKKSLEANSAQ
jgi:predicted transcriptional regulator